MPKHAYLCLQSCWCLQPRLAICQPVILWQHWQQCITTLGLPGSRSQHQVKPNAITVCCFGGKTRHDTVTLLRASLSCMNKSIRCHTWFDTCPSGQANPIMLPHSFTQHPQCTQLSAKSLGCPRSGRGDTAEPGLFAACTAKYHKSTQQTAPCPKSIHDRQSTSDRQSTMTVESISVHTLGDPSGGGSGRGLRTSCPASPAAAALQAAAAAAEAARAGALTPRATAARATAKASKAAARASGGGSVASQGQQQQRGSLGQLQWQQQWHLQQQQQLGIKGLPTSCSWAEQTPEKLGLARAVSPVLQREASSSSSRRVWEHAAAAGNVAVCQQLPASSTRRWQAAVQNAVNEADGAHTGRVRDLDSLPLTAHLQQQQLGHSGVNKQRSRSRSPASHSGHSANHHHKPQHQQRRRRGASSPERPAAGKEQLDSHGDARGEEG